VDEGVLSLVVAKEAGVSFLLSASVNKGKTIIGKPQNLSKTVIY